MEAKRESKNLGELLGIDNNGGGRRLTLLAILSDASCSRTQSAVDHPRRTLQDILRDEEQTSTALGNNGRTIRWSLLKRLNRNNNNAAEETRGEVGQSRTSLMALLEENNRQMELDEEELNSSSTTTHHCCVCMVRHKGAAFIPCGHTFCRLCSRELWVQRGNCPLCNNKILEILDIF